MIPNNKLSSEVLFAEWGINLPDEAFTILSGYELGGEDININTDDLNSRLWRYFYENDTIKLHRTDLAETIDLEVLPGVSQLSLTFNQSLVPTYTYVLNGTTYLKWFDTSDQTYKITNFGSTFKSPKVTLDIKEKLSSASDVLFFYMKGNTELCVRYQRDRFSIEYVLKEMPPHKILRVGMNKLNRIQFLMEELL